MWQVCSLTAVQRKTGFLEQSWWPEVDMFGSMPLSFPGHKLFLRLTPTNCYTVYSLNLIDEFTSLFSPKVIVAGLPRESFPHVFVDISVILWLRKQQPRFAQGQPKKEFHRTSKGIAEMNADWKVDKAQYAEFNVPTCVKIAVWQCRGKTGFLEQSWWPEVDMFGSMPWCLFPWHKLLPRLAQKNCHTTVWIWSMTHPCFRRRWLLQVCLGKAFPMPLWTSVLLCGCAPGFSQG